MTDDVITIDVKDPEMNATKAKITTHTVEVSKPLN